MTAQSKATPTHFQFDLCRHDPVAYRFPYFCTGSEFREHLTAFDCAETEVRQRPESNRWDICFCSPQKRAKATASSIGAFKTLVLDNRLQEVDLRPALDPGTPMPAVYWFQTARLAWRLNWADERETKADTRRRVLSFLNDIYNNHSREKILVVSHKLTIGVLRQLVSDRGGRLLGWGIRHGQVNSVGFGSSPKFLDHLGEDAC